MHGAGSQKILEKSLNYYILIHKMLNSILTLDPGFPNMYVYQKATHMKNQRRKITEIYSNDKYYSVWLGITLNMSANSDGVRINHIETIKIVHICPSTGRCVALYNAYIITQSETQLQPKVAFIKLSNHV